MRAAALAAYFTVACVAAAPAPVRWSGKDVAGHMVEVPQPARTCLVVFVRADQPRSHDALAQLKSLSKEQLQPLQITVVVSGGQAAGSAKDLAKSGECPWPAVADPEYRAAEALAVRVWPTSLVILPSGQVAAHLAGLPPTYARDLDAHLSFATGEIGEAERDRRLAGEGGVAETAQQAAQRRVATIRGLLEKGRREAALALLDEKTEQAVPRWQVALLRGTASAQAGDWDTARNALQEATKLNPEPSEAWYRLGLVHQHLKEWEQASDAFRRAFEATDTGRAFQPSPAGPGDEPRRQ